MATMARRARAASGRKDRMAAKGRRATRRGMWGIARIVSLITSIVVGLILVGILLVVLEANRDNAIVDALREAVLHHLEVVLTALVHVEPGRADLLGSLALALEVGGLGLARGQEEPDPR